MIELDLVRPQILGGFLRHMVQNINSVLKVTAVWFGVVLVVCHGELMKPRERSASCITSENLAHKV